ncbi:MAG: nucleotidyltransferase domain-containing protein [bacterium]
MPIKIGLAKERKKKLEEELGRIIPKIIELNVEKVLLIGSLATGEIHPTSDIDLIIIKETDKRFIERLEEFYTQVKPKIATDFFVYTPEEFDEIKKNNQFIKYALKTGKVIYEKQSN